MPNAWVEHVRKFARDNKLTYGCALSDVNIRKGYVPKGQKAKKKYDEEKKEEEQVKEQEKKKEEEKKQEQIKEIVINNKEDYEAKYENDKKHIINEYLGGYFVSTKKKLESNALKSALLELITSSQDYKSKSQSARTKIRNQVMLSKNDIEMVEIINKYLNYANTPVKVYYQDKDKFFKEFGINVKKSDLNLLSRKREEEKVEDKVEEKKEGYTLYRIYYNGSKGQTRKKSYFVENVRPGLEFNNRKVYDTGLETDEYVYQFDPLDPNMPTGKRVNYKSLLGTLEQNKTLASLVRSGNKEGQVASH